MTNLPLFSFGQKFSETIPSVLASWRIVIWYTHPANGPTDSICFKLAIKSAYDPVNLGHMHLDGCMVLGTNDVVA